MIPWAFLAVHFKMYIFNRIYPRKRSVAYPTILVWPRFSIDGKNSQYDIDRARQIRPPPQFPVPRHFAGILATLHAEYALLSTTK